MASQEEIIQDVERWIHKNQYIGLKITIQLATPAALPVEVSRHMLDKTGTFGNQRESHSSQKPDQ